MTRPASRVPRAPAAAWRGDLLPAAFTLVVLRAAGMLVIPGSGCNCAYVPGYVKCKWLPLTIGKITTEKKTLFIPWRSGSRVVCAALASSGSRHGRHLCCPAPGPSASCNPGTRRTPSHRGWTARVELPAQQRERERGRPSTTPGALEGQTQDTWCAHSQVRAWLPQFRLLRGVINQHV